MPCEFRIRKVTISRTLMKCSSAYLYYVTKDSMCIVQVKHPLWFLFFSTEFSWYYKCYTRANGFFVLLLALLPGIVGSYYWLAAGLATGALLLFCLKTFLYPIAQLWGIPSMHPRIPSKEVLENQQSTCCRPFIF